MEMLDSFLKPLGLPLVGLYCNTRENTFLAYSDTHAKGFEAAGNWMLTPVRYALGGKKVVHIDTKKKRCEIETEVKKEGSKASEILKTVMSIIAFVPSLILGSFFKGASFISEHVRKKNRLISDFITGIDDVPQRIAKNKEFYQSMGICTEKEGVFFNSSPEKKPSLADKNLVPSIKKTLENQKLDIACLGKITEILSDAGILHWADFGTALGVYRHNGMIPWDFDIDISILSQDHTLVKNLLKAKLDKAKFEVWDFSPSSNPESLLKVHVKETGMLIDVYHYLVEENPEDEKDCKITYEFSHKNEWYIPKEALKREVAHSHASSDIFPLKEATFDGVKVMVPNKLEDYLLKKYADSKESRQKSKEERLEELKPSRVWDSVKKEYVKVPHHPYFSQCAYNL